MAPDRTGDKRSRQACNACRGVKQRCDGPPGPCRRCQLFDYDCTFGGSNATAASAPKTTPEHPGSTPTGTVPVPSAVAHAPYTRTGSLDVGASLREISHRLGRLESALLPQSASMEDSTLGYQDFRPPPIDDPSPIAALRMSLGGTGTISARSSGMETAASTEGDAISRGLLTAETVERLFAYFFERLHPLFPVALLETDSDPSVVRKRSVFLFHAILAQAAYYTLLGDAVGRLAYRGLVSLLSDALGHILLFARAKPGSKLDRDSVVAILLSIVRKAIYTDSTDDPESQILGIRQDMSKLNYEIGHTLTGLAHRIMTLIGYNQSPQRLLDAIEVGVALDANHSLVKSTRLLLHHAIVDASGAMQASRSPTFSSPTTSRAALAIVDMLPSSEHLWMAALIEFALLAQDHLGRLQNGKDRAADVAALSQLNRHIRSLLNTWLPRFGTDSIAAAEGGIAMVRRFAVSVQATVLQLSATVALLRRRDAAPIVEGELEVIQAAVDMAKHLLLQLCEPSMPGSPPQSVDRKLAAQCTFWTDHLLCVILPFAALFILRQSGNDPEGMHLVALCIDFLDYAAPNKTHPAVTHANMLRLYTQQVTTATEDIPIPEFSGANAFLASLMPFPQGEMATDLIVPGNDADSPFDWLAAFGQTSAPFTGF